MTTFIKKYCVFEIGEDGETINPFEEELFCQFDTLDAAEKALHEFGDRAALYTILPVYQCE